MRTLCVARGLQPTHLVIHVCLDFAKQLSLAQYLLVFKARRMRGVSMAVAQLVGKWQSSQKTSQVRCLVECSCKQVAVHL
jgi:hypothetical protein